MAKVDKFKYLQSYLEEPASSVVMGFSLTDSAYDSAVELLKTDTQSQASSKGPT